MTCWMAKYVYWFLVTMIKYVLLKEKVGLLKGSSCVLDRRIEFLGKNFLRDIISINTKPHSNQVSSLWAIIDQVNSACAKTAKWKNTEPNVLGRTVTRNESRVHHYEFIRNVSQSGRETHANHCWNPTGNSIHRL